MSQPMNTDVAAQAASASTIQGIADTFQAILGQLQADVDTTAAIWKGGSHTAFMGGTTEIHSQLQRGQATLQEVSEKTGKTGVGYGSTDASSASALGSTNL